MTAEVMTVLKRVIDEQDDLADHARVSALLKDLLPELPREVSALTLALGEQVPVEIQAADGDELEPLAAERLAQRLHDRKAMDTGWASWSVATWAQALGKRPANDTPAPGSTPVTVGSPSAYPVIDADNAASLMPILTIGGGSGAVDRVDLSPDLSQVASGGEDGVVRIWDARDGQLLQELKGSDKSLRGLGFDPVSGARIATGDSEGWLTMWDVAGATKQWRVRGHKRAVNDLVWNPSGRTFASASRDGTARLWRSDTGLEARKYHYTDASTTLGYPSSIAIDKTGKHLATGHEYGYVVVWDLAQAAALRRLHPAGKHKDYSSRPDRWSTVAFDESDKQLIYATSGPGGLPELSRQLPAVDRGNIWSLAACPAYRLLAASTERGAIFVWDLKSGERLCELTGGDNVVERVVFSQDGTRLASACHDGFIKLWAVDAL